MMEKYEVKKFRTPCCDPGVFMSCVHKHGEVKGKLSQGSLSCVGSHFTPRAGAALSLLQV